MPRAAIIFFVASTLFFSGCKSPAFRGLFNPNYEANFQSPGRTSNLSKTPSQKPVDSTRTRSDTIKTQSGLIDSPGFQSDSSNAKTNIIEPESENITITSPDENVLRNNRETPQKRELEPLSMLSLLTFVLLFWLLFPVPVALVLGIISLVKFKRNPGKYWGKGFAITAVIFSSLILLFIIYVGILITGLAGVI